MNLISITVHEFFVYVFCTLTPAAVNDLFSFLAVCNIPFSRFNYYVPCASGKKTLSQHSQYLTKNI